MPKVNNRKLAKRRKIEAKDRRSPHTRLIERQALERAGGRCEVVWRDPYHVAESSVRDVWSHPLQAEEGTTGGGITTMVMVRFETRDQRCTETEGLELHHKSYPKGRKLTVDHVLMACDSCHNRIEALKPVHRKIA
jgi:hypothetical protein